MRRTLMLLTLLALAMAGACASRSRGPLPPAPPRTAVRVENRNFLDMHVYVLNGSQRIRLGTVSGVSTRTLRIPDHLVFGMRSLRFQADPIGGRVAPVSQEITVRPGDEVLLVIPG